MITVNPADHERIDITVEGSVTKEDMQGFLDQFSAIAERMERGHILFTVTDFHWPSLGAIGFEITHLGQFLRAYRHFERAAVICDTAWIRKVSEWEGHLFSWIEIKAFTPDELELATNWLNYGDAEEAA